jgi:hypothetical protein
MTSGVLLFHVRVEEVKRAVEEVDGWSVLKGVTEL